MNGDDPRGLGALQSAVNDAATSTSTLWIGFLTFASYLTIATGGIQGADLLIEKPLTMPLLDTQIPLFGFGILAPILLAIFHFYLLLQFQGLAQKAMEYNELIERQVPIKSDQQLVRQRFGNFVLLQLLCGPLERRAGYTRLLLRSIMWLTTVAAPIGIFFLIEIKFLPYHSEALTWLHRSLIALDLILVAAFWTSIRGGHSTLALRHELLPFDIPALAASFAAFRGMLTTFILALAVFVAAFPGEHIYRLSDNRLRELLFEGDSDPLTPNSESPFANRIIAEDFASEHPPSFRSRNLDRAILRKANLKKADFRNASLVGADLSETDLRDALFDCETEDCPANLRGAQFNGADLRAAQLMSVVAIGASFSAAKLQGANLSAAILKAADLRNANLAGADLSNANFNAASLDRADFTAAMLPPAQRFMSAVIFNAIGLPASRIPDSALTIERWKLDGFREKFGKTIKDLICMNKDDTEDQDNIDDSAHFIRGLIRNGILFQYVTGYDALLLHPKETRCWGALRLSSADLETLSPVN